MTTRWSVKITGAVAGLTLAAMAAGCGGNASGSTAATAPLKRLSGTLHLAAGQCHGRHAKPNGSYFVVISAASGKLVSNRQGGCANPSYTLLRPGSAGGIRLAGFQPPPNPSFDSRGDATADSIARPVSFDGRSVGLATDTRDEQDAPTGAPAFPAPQAVVNGHIMHLDLRSLVFLYGGRPGSTCARTYGAGCWNLGSRSATGSYDPTTHRFSVQWFTGESFTPKGDSLVVHLEGTLTPAGRATS